MLNTDPRFRSVMADVEKASTGEMLKKALVEYEKRYEMHSDGEIIAQDSSMPLYGINGYTGAIAFLDASHYANVNDHTDPTWNIPPDPGPGVVILDFDPDEGYIDQDGNPVHL